MGLACLALAGGCGGEDPPPARGDFVGLVTEDVFAGDDVYRDEMLERQAAAGVGLIRQTFDWAKIEVEQGRYDFSLYDDWLEDVAKKRMRVLPILFNPPAFHSSRPVDGAKRGTYPPDDLDALADFASAAAKRYGRDGTFWDEHDVPKTPIRSWQIWNEPNIPVYWPNGPDAAEYTRMLRAAADALRSVDPAAEIVTAGLPRSNRGIPFERYLNDMLAEGAADAADVIAIHPYASTARAAIDAVRQTRRTLRERGLKNPIWVTEIGWATQGPESAFTFGMRGQAVRIERFFAEVARVRRRLGIRGVVYYNWRDSEPFEGGFDFFGLHTGLLTLNGVEKPGLRAFQRGARALVR